MVKAKQAEQSILEQLGCCDVGGLRRKAEMEYKEMASVQVPWNEASLCLSKEKEQVLNFQVKIMSSAPPILCLWFQLSMLHIGP